MNFIEIIKELIDRKEIVTTTLIAIISSIVLYYKKLISVHLTRFVKSCSYDKEFIASKIKYFVPNNFKVIANGRYIDTKEYSIIPYFIKHVFKDNKKSPYMVVAPTGVGKTTFAAMLYTEYSKLKYRVNLRRPSLLFGKFHNESTLDEMKFMIDKKMSRYTIVLLDSMDEFSVDDYLQKGGEFTVDMYWKLFWTRWEVYKPILVRFKKVIITVREQFFVHSSYELFENKLFHDDTRWIKVELLPFKEESQRKEYFSLRFPKEQDYNRVANVSNRIYSKNPTACELPLLLFYMGDIANAFYSLTQENKKAFFTTINIYHIIVDKWINREMEKNLWTDEMGSQLLAFCEKIAFHFRHSISSFPISDFEKMENSTVMGSIFESVGINDRSLFVKSNKESIQFIHRNFHEYFLANYILKNPSIEHAINFEEFPLALKIIIGERWRTNEKPTKLNISSHVIYDLSEKPMLAFGINEKESYMNFLKTLINNENGYKYFLNNFNQILSEEDFEWRMHMSTFKNVRLHDYDLVVRNYDDELMLTRFLKVFNEFLKHATFMINDSETKDSIFKHCIGLNSLEQLDIFGAYSRNNFSINGECLAYFSNCRSLKHLAIHNFDKFKEDSLKVFEPFKNIVHLNLSKLNLSGSSLEYFKESSRTIKTIELENNNIRSYHLKDLLYFHSLQYLSLKNCGIENHDVLNQLIKRGVSVVY